MARVFRFEESQPPTPELFAPDNFLEVCQGLQEGIAMAPPDEKDTAGAQARDVIGDNATYEGATNLEVRTLGAYALPDGLSFEEIINPVVRFNELRLRGRLSQVAYLRVGQIRSLSWMMIDPTIRSAVPTFGASGPGEEVPDRVDVGFAGDRLRRPLYLPVGMIESVMIAA